MTLMEDATNVANLDPSAPVVAVYMDGLYRTTLAAVRARCPNSAVAWITVLANPQGQIYDCEPGNGTPTNAATYAMQRLALGFTPIVYCGEMTWWTTIEGLINAAGGGGRVLYWVANYNGIQAIPAGADAKQYADPGPVDLSQVDDKFLAAIGATTPPPGDPPEMFHGEQDFDAIANSIQGIGGQANPSQAYFAALLAGVQGLYNLGLSSGLTNIDNELKTIQGELDNVAGSSGGTLTEAQAASLATIAEATGRIEAALKGA